MDEKSLKEVLETPQINQFQHENVFGASFKEEFIKVIFAKSFFSSSSRQKHFNFLI
jgi:hypothetical protein